MKGTQEEETRRLIEKLLPGSPFAGRVFAVGGFVRDRLLGLEAKDLDLVVESPGGAQAFAAWLHERLGAATSTPHELGAGYPIWQLAFKEDVTFASEAFACKGSIIEIADTQSESFPDPTTRQRITRFGTLDEDCARRDFTVNMLYLDLSTGQVRDPSTLGLADLKAGLLRGHPRVDLKKIFSDDPLRMIRLIRFHCVFGWRIPGEVLADLKACAPRAQILSHERVRDELVKIMKRGKLAPALELMRDAGLVELLLPELLPMMGCGQDKVYHSEGDVWVHTLLVIRHAPATIPLQLAALLHDVGKPATRSEHGERVKFLGHEQVSTQIASPLLARLRFDSATVKKVLKLVALHLRGSDVAHWATLKPARRLLRDAGDEIEELLQLIEADSRSSLSADGTPRLEHIGQLRAKLEAAQQIPIRKETVLNGNEIMRVLALRPGLEVGHALEFLRGLEDECAEAGRAIDAETAISALTEWHRARQPLNKI